MTFENHHEPECHAKKWDSIFKAKVTVWAYIIKIGQFLLYILLVLNSETFATKLNVDHYKQRSVQRKFWIAVFKVNVTAKVKSFS